MLETIRAFGLECLVASGEESSVRQALASWCIALAEETEPPLLGLLESRTFARLEADLGNLRTTLTWLEETGDAVAALRLAAALGPFWYFRGHLEEGREWLERTLRDGVDAPALVRAKALFWLGTLSVMRGDTLRGVALLEEGQELHRQSGDRAGVIAATIMLGGAEEYRGGDHAAMACYGEALELSREVGENRLTLWSLINLADGAYRLGEHDRSAALAGEALNLSASTEDRMLHAFALIVAGQVALDRGDVAEASCLFGESLSLSRAADNHSGHLAALVGSAAVQLAGGRAERAVRLLGAADAAREVLGVHVPLNHELQRRTERAARAGLPEGDDAAAWAAGRLLTAAEAVAEAEVAAAEPATSGAPRRDGGHLAEDHGLTAREREVLRLLADGCTDREIGDALFISWRTAQAHVGHIFAKLGVSTRTSAVAAALRADLV
jgi:non-specific serine/threonine protein kinase